VLTIARLSRWSINYYNDTARQAQQAAMDRQRANGGLGEYYSERDTRTPTWLFTRSQVPSGKTSKRSSRGETISPGSMVLRTPPRW
jgi:hypothetical protein